MTQDLPPAVGPHGQQPWYPGHEAQQQPQPQSQQPWPAPADQQWQQGIPAQREPDGYPAGYQTQFPTHFPTQAPAAYGYGEYPAYGDGHPGEADGQLYAPAGAEHSPDGYVPFEPDPAPEALPVPVPVASATDAVTVRAERTRGATVPGSGQRFIIRFTAP